VGLAAVIGKLPRHGDGLMTAGFSSNSEVVNIQRDLSHNIDLARSPTTTILHLAEAQRGVGAPETETIRKCDTDFFLLGYIGNVVAVKVL
jgi:hypothetical protein